MNFTKNYELVILFVLMLKIEKQYWKQYWKRVLEAEELKSKLLTEIGRFRLTEISVEIGSMRFFQTRTQPEIREFYMTSCIQ